MVMDVAPDASRFAISIAHLEVNPGDFLVNKASVYNTAPEVAARLQQQMMEEQQGEQQGLQQEQ